MQRDLSIAYGRMGDVNMQEGHAVAARNAYKAKLDISRKLAQADPGNVDAQGGLSERRRDMRRGQFPLGRHGR